MGTGKSTVGKQIANRLGWLFIDTDDLIEEKAGMSISNIFVKQGEAYFRALERQVIDNVCCGTGKVIATGGGAMTIEENVRRLQEGGTVICLTAEPDIILSRVRNNTDRLSRKQVPTPCVAASLSHAHPHTLSRDLAKKGWNY